MTEQQQTRAEWLAERRLGIGGSDVAAILGLSKWQTPLDVYLEKRGELETDDVDSEPMHWGRKLEPIIRQEYVNRTGVAVKVPSGAFVHPVHSFMRANVDGLTFNDRVFEAKTARTADGWGEPGTDEIPDAYMLQVQHYMIVTGRESADVAVLIGGSDFRLYAVDADPDLQQYIIEAESAFWQRVVDGDPPPPVTYAETVRTFGHVAAEGAVTADAEAEANWSELVKVRAEIKKLTELEEQYKTEIMQTLADKGEALVTPEGKTLVTWKLAKAPARFDATAFKNTHPDLYAEYTVAGTPSRRMLIKE